MITLAPYPTPGVQRPHVSLRAPGLDALAVRLAAEYPEMSAGSVLRSVLRAAHGLRITGIPRARMVVEVERVTRRSLERRSGRASATALPDGLL